MLYIIHHNSAKVTISTRSPPATPHHLQNPKWLPGAPKWPTGSGKGSNPRFLGAPVNFL